MGGRCGCEVRILSNPDARRCCGRPPPPPRRAWRVAPGAEARARHARGARGDGRGGGRRVLEDEGWGARSVCVYVCVGRCQIARAARGAP